MKFYIAASNQERAKVVARCLELAGHTVISRWLYKEFRRTDEMTVMEREALARECIEDILLSQALVLLAEPNGERVPGGKFVELGIAIGVRRKIFLIGRRENLMTYWREVIQVESVSELIAKAT